MIKPSFICATKNTWHLCKQEAATRNGQNHGYLQYFGVKPPGWCRRTLLSNLEETERLLVVSRGFIQCTAIDRVWASIGASHCASHTTRYPLTKCHLLVNAPAHPGAQLEVQVGIYISRCRGCSHSKERLTEPHACKLMPA